MMLEELQRRNYSAITTRNYLRVVTEFAKCFGKSPDKLGPNELRTYQAYLLTECKLTPGTVVNRVAALRFFFVKTLKRHQFRDFLPYPQDRRRLPTVLSREEVARLINAAGTLFRRTLLMTLYATGMRRSELARLKVSDIDSQRMTEIGVIGILHTWGQNLLLHPHIHCVIPAGGLSPDHRRWIRPRYPFFLPVKVLSRVFRGKFLAGLKRLHHRHQLCCAGPTVALADPQQFAKLMRRLHRHDWVVYAKPAFGGPLQVLRYLGRYTHRVAISNHRLLAFDQELVTFRWKDYAHGGKQGKMTLLATEFLRRFFLHVLPRGFVRIRHFGFLANRFRASRLALSQQLLSSNSTPPAEVVICANSSQTSPLWHCPR